MIFVKNIKKHFISDFCGTDVAVRDILDTSEHSKSNSRLVVSGQNEGDT